MPQYASYERVPKSWELSEPELLEGLLKLKSNDSPFSFTFETIRPNVFRTTFTSPTHVLPPRPSARKPEIIVSLAYHRDSAAKQVALFTPAATAKVTWQYTPEISISVSEFKEPLHRDLPFRSYTVDGDGVSHYTCYNRNALHVGLGEKAAPMDLSNRGFALSATDSFGYDAYRTDPLYKVIPLLVSATPDGCVAVFSTSHSRGFYSVGHEVDGMWGHYKVLRQDHGGLEEYVIIGKTLQDVIKSYADIVGYPRLMPRWAFGYIAGGMKYSMLDDPPAHEALFEFAEKLKQHEIPCSAFQMSSGYTVSQTPPKTRNVFTWNYHRFPDPKGFVDAYHRRGIRLLANVKPYVLANHPAYRKLADANAFFRDPKTKTTAVCRLWSAGGGESGEGSHIDFTSAAGFHWWYEGVQSLRKVGIDVPWNDNNEYTIPDDDWECALDEPSIQEDRNRLESWGIKNNTVGLWGRSLQTELNGKSSFDALVDLEPERRPFVLTRSATAGTMRYAASTWSGDNVTSWESFRGANSLAINAGVCLLQCYGHDTGGFEGPQPSRALLLRWIQTACHTSRFAINCFKTSSADNNVGDVIEPWMYPDITHLVRKAIQRRYEILPYIYSLALKSHLTAVPPQRWVGWGYESDPEVWTRKLTGDQEQFWMGDCLLIGGVFEEGAEKARMYLPKKGDDYGYIDVNSPSQRFAPGQWIDIDAPWDASIPVLAKMGTAIPVGKNVQVLSPGETHNPAGLPADDYRAVELYPPDTETWRKCTTTWLEDDGISASPEIVEFSVSYECLSSGTIQLSLRAGESEWRPSWKELFLILPAGDDRELVGEHGGELELAKEQMKVDSRARKIYRARVW